MHRRTNLVRLNFKRCAGRATFEAGGSLSWGRLHSPFQGPCKVHPAVGVVLS